MITYVVTIKSISKYIISAISYSLLQPQCINHPILVLAQTQWLRQALQVMHNIKDNGIMFKKKRLKVTSHFKSILVQGHYSHIGNVAENECKYKLNRAGILHHICRNTA